MINFQYISIEKNYKYEICIHYKLKNITAFQIYIGNHNTLQYYEVYYLDIYKGTNEWTKECYTVGPIKKSSSESNSFF